MKAQQIKDEMVISSDEMVALGKAMRPYHPTTLEAARVIRHFEEARRLDGYLKLIEKGEYGVTRDSWDGSFYVTRQDGSRETLLPTT